MSAPASPGGQHFRRRQGAGHDEFVVAAAQPDHVQIRRRRDHELGARQQGGPRRFGVQDRAGAKQDLMAETVGHAFQDLHRLRTVKVTSQTSMPPARRAWATSTNWSPLSARITATIPVWITRASCSGLLILRRTLFRESS